MGSVGWDNEDVGQIKPFQGSTGMFYRACIMDAEAAHAFLHYLDRKVFSVGGSHHCTKETEGRCYHCEKETDRSERFAARIVTYLCDPQNGQVIEPVRYRITWWRFGSGMFSTVRSIRVQVKDLRQVDLLLKCTNSKFQNFEVSVAPDGRCLWVSDPALQKAVADKYKMMREKLDLDRLLGRRLTYDEQSKLYLVPNVSAPGSSGGYSGAAFGSQRPAGSDGFGAGAKDVSALLDSVAAPVAAPTGSPAGKSVV